MIYSIRRRVGISVLQRLPKPLRRVRLPYPAPKKKRRLSASLLFWNPWDIEKHRGQVNCPCANAFAEQKHFTAQKRRASTRRSASRLDSNYLTAEVNSAYNNSPLRCELTRDFARRTRGTLKCSGEVNSPCANAFAEQKHFTAQKRRASTRRSASRLDSNYLTAEVNSAYNNSPLRCELTRDFARRTRGTLKCSGEVNSPCANAFAQQKHFTAQKRRGERSG